MKIKPADNSEGRVRQDFVAIDTEPATCVDVGMIFNAGFMTSTGEFPDDGLFYFVLTGAGEGDVGGTLWVKKESKKAPASKRTGSSCTELSGF